jgi:dTDP-glucose 4,6-dehydratase
MKGCGTVYHLAALIGIPYSYISPLAYIRTNVEGTYNVLEGGRQLGLDQVLITSTSETYGTAQYVPIDEAHPLKAQSPYSATKIAADHLALSFFCSFELPVKIVRPFNTYGPRQSARAVIPSIITQILSGRRRIKLGNLTPTRDLTFVRDTVEGFLAIARSDKLLGEVTNIGTGEEKSIGDLVRQIARIMKVDVDPVGETCRIRPKESEVDRLVCSSTKLRRETRWEPRTPLDEGLAETIDWLRSHMDDYKAMTYNI